MNIPSATPLRRFSRRLALGAVLAAALPFAAGIGRAAPAQIAIPAAGPVPANAPEASEINAFLAADAKQMPPTGAVLFIGSSSVRFWTTLAQDFSEIPVINRGFGGSFIRQSTLYADRIAIPYRPKMIVLCAGTNDLAYGNESPEQVFQDYKDFVAKIHAALPGTRIVFLTVNPTVARWKQEPKNLELNFLIERFVVENNSPTNKLSVLDPHFELLTADGLPQPKLLRADGLHFNAEGYRVWTSLIKPKILALAAMEGVARRDAATAPQP